VSPADEGRRRVRLALASLDEGLGAVMTAAEHLAPVDGVGEVYTKLREVQDQLVEHRRALHELAVHHAVELKVAR
jgi:hypothetical protein